MTLEPLASQGALFCVQPQPAGVHGSVCANAADAGVTGVDFGAIGPHDVGAISAHDIGAIGPHDIEAIGPHDVGAIGPHSVGLTRDTPVCHTCSVLV